MVGAGEGGGGKFVPPTIQNNVCKILLLWRVITLLVFNKLLLNLVILLILRDSFQWSRRIFPNLTGSLFGEKNNEEREGTKGLLTGYNLSMSKVFKKPRKGLFEYCF